MRSSLSSRLVQWQCKFKIMQPQNHTTWIGPCNTQSGCTPATCFSPNSITMHTLIRIQIPVHKQITTLLPANTHTIPIHPGTCVRDSYANVWHQPRALQLSLQSLLLSYKINEWWCRNTDTAPFALSSLARFWWLGDLVRFLFSFLQQTDQHHDYNMYHTCCLSAAVFEEGLHITKYNRLSLFVLWPANRYTLPTQQCQG